MTQGLASSHELATAACEARIAAGLIAHCSGKAQDFTRDTAARIRRLWDIEGPGIGGRRSFEIHVDSQGESRVIIDTDSGYWDHVISEASAARFIGRLEPVAPAKESVSC